MHHVNNTTCCMQQSRGLPDTHADWSRHILCSIIIPLNLHVSVLKCVVNTYFTTLVQPMLYSRLYRKRTCQNCSPVGPCASYSLYIWCQHITKSTTSFLTPTLQPFITAWRQTNTPVVSTLPLANPAGHGFKTYVTIFTTRVWASNVMS